MAELHGSWTPENRAFLSALIERKYTSSPIAVIDWDNTFIRGDIGEALFHHLAADLAFRFDAPRFLDWLTEVSPVDYVSTAYADWRKSPDEFTHLALRLAFERARKAYYDGMDDGAACAWEGGAFIGWPVETAREYARHVIAAELAHPFTVEHFEFEGEHLEIPRGLCVRPAMLELIGTLQRSGWAVWVLSGSPQWVVEPFATLYGIPAERVVGMRRAIVGGILTNEVEPPVSFSDGKLDAYQRFVDCHQPPWLVAADSVNDWKLLEWAEGARLLIHPTNPDLRKYALWQRSLDLPWIIQEFSETE